MKEKGDWGEGGFSRYFLPGCLLFHLAPSKNLVSLIHGNVYFARNAIITYYSIRPTRFIKCATK